MRLIDIAEVIILQIKTISYPLLTIRIQHRLLQDRWTWGGCCGAFSDQISWRAR